MPHKKAKRPHEPERDYSHRSLLDKLGVKAGQRVAVLAVQDRAFLHDLAARVPDFSQEARGSDVDLIFFATEDVKGLARLKTLARKIQKNGAIWVITPKGRKDIRDIEVIAAGKAAGLVDNKVVGFSATHTSLRFVIPLAKR
jgi:hypothetical protein